jgi:hypothetical protein
VVRGSSETGYPSGGNLYSGYLWVRNANAEDVFGYAPYPCIMRAGDTGIAAYLEHDLCPSTRGQIGWRDKDYDGVPNVVGPLRRCASLRRPVSRSPVAALPPLPVQFEVVASPKPSDTFIEGHVPGRRAAADRVDDGDRSRSRTSRKEPQQGVDLAREAERTPPFDEVQRSHSELIDRDDACLAVTVPGDKCKASSEIVEHRSAGGVDHLGPSARRRYRRPSRPPCPPSPARCSR